MDVFASRPPSFVAGPLLGLIVVAVIATLNERLGVAQLVQGRFFGLCTIAGIGIGIGAYLRWSSVSVAMRPRRSTTASASPGLPARDRRGGPARRGGRRAS